MTVAPSYVRRDHRPNPHHRVLGTGLCSTCGFHAEIVSTDPTADPWSTLAELFLNDLNGCPYCPGAMDIEVGASFIDQPSPPPTRPPRRSRPAGSI